MYRYQEIPYEGNIQKKGGHHETDKKNTNKGQVR